MFGLWDFRKRPGQDDLRVVRVLDKNSQGEPQWCYILECFNRRSWWFIKGSYDREEIFRLKKKWEDFLARGDNHDE
jgi:hypothetical protein